MRKIYLIGYITTKNKSEAKKIGKKLLKEKLIACVNYLGEIESNYWWKNEIIEDKEFSLIIKTRNENRKEIIEEVKELHSYENPCIIFIEIESGSKEYLEWINKNTKEE